MPLNNRVLDANEYLLDFAFIEFKQGSVRHELRSTARPDQRDNSVGSRGLVKRLEGNQREPPVVQITVPPALNSSNPNLLSFVLQGRTAIFWTLKPKQCFQCKSQNVELKELGQRLLLDLPHPKTLVFRRCLCKNPQCKVFVTKQSCCPTS